MANSPLVFPLARCTGVVRQIAQQLDCLHGEVANQYWRSEAKRIGDRLLWIGIDPDTISDNLSQLLEAVQTELQRGMFRSNGGDCS